MQGLPGGFDIPEVPEIDDDSDGKSPLSAKQESRFILYVDQKMLDISRMYKRRAVETNTQAVASEALDELLDEISALVLVLRQVPVKSAALVTAYALSILDNATDYIVVFNQAPDTTFSLLQKLDALFVYLLKHSVMSITERIRLEALATRLRNSMYTKYQGQEDHELLLSQVFEGSITYNG